MSGARRAVVVGAGVGGLSTALALSQDGHRVLVLERDDRPAPLDLDGAAEWERQGAPQFHHSHVFMPRFRRLLVERFPDVHRDLLDAGAPEHNVAEELFQVPPRTAGAEDLVVLPCRRTVLEWVLRRRVEADPRVELRPGSAVAGVVGRNHSDGAPAVVTGVRTSRGETIDADLVVATTGRRGDVPAWLASLGVVIAEDVHDVGLVYFSRFYRLLSDDTPEFGFRVGRRAGLGFLGYEADNRTFSVTLVLDPADGELRRHLSEPGRYDATGRVIPELAPWLDETVSRPIGPVNVHGGLINRLRTFGDDCSRPLAERFFAIGDAYLVTNPLYARGCTVPFIQACLLADAIRAHPDDVVAQFAAFEEGCQREIAPWFNISVLLDQLARRNDDGSDFVGLAGPHHDPEVALVLARAFSMLDPPATLAADPRVVEALGPAGSQRRADRRSRPPGSAVTRADLLAARPDRTVPA